jgi:hypothetical protein
MSERLAIILQQATAPVLAEKLGMDPLPRTVRIVQQVAAHPGLVKTALAAGLLLVSLWPLTTALSPLTQMPVVQEAATVQPAPTTLQASVAPTPAWVPTPAPEPEPSAPEQAQAAPENNMHVHKSAAPPPTPPPLPSWAMRARQPHPFHGQDYEVTVEVFADKALCVQAIHRKYDKELTLYQTSPHYQRQAKVERGAERLRWSLTPPMLGTTQRYEVWCQETAQTP